MAWFSSRAVSLNAIKFPHLCLDPLRCLHGVGEEVTQRGDREGNRCNDAEGDPSACAPRKRSAALANQADGDRDKSESAERECQGNGENKPLREKERISTLDGGDREGR